MSKSIVLFFFLFIFNFTYQIEAVDLNKYYNFAINFFEGLSKTGNQTCANILKQDKDHYMKVINKILYEVEIEQHTIPIAIFNNLFDLLFLEENCHISELLTLYLGIQIKEVFEAKLVEIGRALKGVLEVEVK